MKAALELEMYRGDGGAGETGRGGRGAFGEKVSVKALKRWETKQASKQSLPVNGRTVGWKGRIIFFLVKSAGVTRTTHLRPSRGLTPALLTLTR